MTEAHDIPYLVMRERQAREMSAEPGDVAVQFAHLKMADVYAAQIRAFGAPLSAA